MNASQFSSFETLRDGRRVHVRAQRPDDEAGFRAALARASDEAIYRRFMGPRREFSAAEAEYFLDIDFVNHVALVVEAKENGADVIVAGARYIVVSPGVAEVAFAIINDYQGQGLGGRLFNHLVEIGRAAGIKEFVAEVLSDNQPMLKVFKRARLPVTKRLEGTQIHVSMRLDEGGV